MKTHTTVHLSKTLANKVFTTTYLDNPGNDVQCKEMRLQSIKFTHPDWWMINFCKKLCEVGTVRRITL